MNKRLNITLPEQTVPLMDRVAGQGQRSSFIDRAVRRYVKEETRANLRKQLTEPMQHIRRTIGRQQDLQLASTATPYAGGGCIQDAC